MRTCEAGAMAYAFFEDSDIPPRYEVAAAEHVGDGVNYWLCEDCDEALMLFLGLVA